MSVRHLPLVSIIVPGCDAEQHIAPCLDAILANGYSSEHLEVLVVGSSSDRTRAIVTVYAQDFPQIRLLDGSCRSIPAALNLGIQAAAGSVLIWMEASVKYPPGYIARLVEALDRYGADDVGGLLHTLPANDGALARAIAITVSPRSPNALGASDDRPRRVRSVPFFCIRREVVDLVGMFDEDLTGGHDVEFTSRLNQRGCRLLLVPGVTSSRLAPATLRHLALWFYQRGYSKMLMAWKARHLPNDRHLAAPLFLLGLLASGLLIPAWIPAAMALAVLAAVYLLTVVFTALPAAHHGPKVALGVVATLPVMHFSYALGFWRCLIDLLLALRNTMRLAPRLPSTR